MLYIGADHRGFKLKEQLQAWLEGEGHVVTDVGAKQYNEEDDYPIFAGMVGRGVMEKAGGLGVLLCGSGVGAVAAANKIDGVRASLGLRSKQVAAGKHDDNMNVLVIAADYTSFEESKELVQIFLETDFNTSVPRYQRRIDQITELEQE